MYDRGDKVLDSKKVGWARYDLVEHGVSYLIYCDGRVYQVYSSYVDAINAFSRIG